MGKGAMAKAGQNLGDDTMTLEEFMIVTLESALERTKEHEMRCQRRMARAQEELQLAMASTRAKSLELDRAREHYLRGAV